MKNRAMTRLISAAASCALLSFFLFPADNIAKAYPLTSPAAVTINAHNKTSSDNPFNKQDDKEVPYDATRWIQPVEWNTPKIDPRDYDGGLMLFFDKIGLERENARGKVQRVYCSIIDVTEPVSYVKFHIFYDTRLTVKKNSAGEFLNVGKGLSGFTTGSAMVEEGELAFYAYAEDTLLDRSCLFTIDFILPEDAERGDVYPIGMAYVDDGIVADTFIDSQKSGAGKLQMTYLFTKGIYNGYIKVLGQKPPPLGDVNNDGLVNSIDASSVLTYYAMVSTGRDGGLSEDQETAADVDKNDMINATDASYILEYYAYASTVEGEAISMKEYMQERNK